MGTMILKCAAIVALVLATAIEGATSNLEIFLGFVVCASGVAVAAQAVRAGKYIWAAMFATVAVLFNPIFAIQAAQSGNFVLSGACVTGFVLSLFLLEDAPKRTIASITEQAPSSESL